MHLTLHAAVFAAVLLAVAASCPQNNNFVVGSYTGLPGFPNKIGVSLLTYVSFVEDTRIVTTNELGPERTGPNPSSVAFFRDSLYAANNVPDGSVSLVSPASRGSRESRRSSNSLQSLPTRVKLSTRGQYASHIHRDGTLLVVTNRGMGKRSGGIATFESGGERLNALENFRFKRIPNLEGKQRPRTPHPLMAVPFHGFYAVPDAGLRAVHLLKINKFNGKIKHVSVSKIGTLSNLLSAAVHSRSGALYVMSRNPPNIATMYLGKRENKNNLQGKFGIKKAFLNYNRKDTLGGTIRVSKDGRFLYASIRYGGKREGSIVCFRLEKRTGRIGKRISETPTRGVYPHDFILVDRLSYGGKCVSAIAVVNMKSNNLVLIQRNRVTGKLSRVLSKQTVLTPTSVISY